MPLDVLLVGDHKITRDGMKASLNRSSEFRVVGEAENEPDAFSSIQRLRPHMILVDIDVPGSNVVETTQELLRFHPECKVVILSMYEDGNSAFGALRAGARAFILRRDSDMDLVEILRQVADGGLYVSPRVLDRLQARIPKGVLKAPHSHSAPKRRSPRGPGVLRRAAEAVRKAVQRKH